MSLITSRYRPWVVYAGCSLTALAILSTNLHGGVVAGKIESILLALLTPVYSTVDYSLDKAVMIWEQYIYLVDLKQENLILREALGDQRSREYQYQEAVSAIERYRQILDFTHRDPAHFHPHKIVADVIRQSNDSWNSTMLVNAGDIHGVQSAMGVATVDGVLGQVVRVGHNISKILSLQHPEAGVAARLETSGILGIVSGIGHRTCIFKFGSRFDRVILGELAVTSGLDGAFPKGIPIGRVSRIEKTPEEIFQKVEIIPLVDASSVEEVIIFLKEPIENLE